jgi:hypothetical protein
MIVIFIIISFLDRWEAGQATHAAQLHESHIIIIITSSSMIIFIGIIINIIGIIIIIIHLLDRWEAGQATHAVQLHELHIIIAAA